MKTLIGLVVSSNYDITPPHATFVWLLLSAAAAAATSSPIPNLAEPSPVPGRAPAPSGSLNIYLVKARHLDSDITALANSGTGQDNFCGLQGKYLKLG